MGGLIFNVLIMGLPFHAILIIYITRYITVYNIFELEMTHNGSAIITFLGFLGKIQKAFQQQMLRTVTDVDNVTGCLVMNNTGPSVRKKLDSSIKVNYGTFSPPVTLAAQTQLPW